ncbi:MAG: SGNH/GDSL hydrolase family protein [Bryobacteraceae bacterium]
MLFSKQTPAAGGTAFAQFDAAWCYDGNGYILNDTGTSLDVRIGASGSVQTLASGATLPIKLVFSMAELYVRRTDQSTTQVTVEAQVGTGSAGGGTTPVQAGVIAAATAAAATAAHNADAGAHGGGNPVIASLRRVLTRGVSNVTIPIIGDSTAAANYAWGGRFAAAMASKYSAYSVLYSQWDSVNNAWGNAVTIQTGTGGEPALTTTAAVPATYPATLAPLPRDGVFEWIFDRSQADWSAAVIWMDTAAVAGIRPVRIRTSSSYLLIQWSEDGGTNLAKSAQFALDAGTFTAGSRHRLKLKFTTATGAVSLYRWVAGAWAQVGSTSTAGATSLKPNTTVWELYGAGTWYEIGMTVGGLNNFPLGLACWSFNTGSQYPKTWTVSGSPTLLVLSGGYSGAWTTTWSDDARATAALSRYRNAQLCLVALGLNGGYATGADYVALLDTLHAKLIEKTSAGVCYVGVSPRLPIAGFDGEHDTRLSQLPGWCARKGAPYISVTEAFLSDPRGLSALIREDGIHPTDPAGYTLFGETVAGLF